MRRATNHCSKTALREKLLEAHGVEVHTESLKGEVRVSYPLPV